MNTINCGLSTVNRGPFSIHGQQPVFVELQSSIPFPNVKKKLVNS